MDGARKKKPQVTEPGAFCLMISRTCAGVTEVGRMTAITRRYDGAMTVLVTPDLAWNVPAHAAAQEATAMFRAGEAMMTS